MTTADVAIIALFAHERSRDRGDGDRPALARRFPKALESVYPLSVPLEVDIGIGDHWADA
jgi:hypothetical protein